MPSEIEDRLIAQGHRLPAAAAPAANYLPWVVEGTTLFISGQLPFIDGRLLATGKLGAEVALDDGIAAARQCALNVLAQAKAACGGDLGNLKRCLKLTGFVSSSPDFAEQHKVMNGASDLLVAALGDAGRHARSAVGVPALPLNAAVEVEAIFGLA